MSLTHEQRSVLREAVDRERRRRTAKWATPPAVRPPRELSLLSPVTSRDKKIKMARDLRSRGWSAPKIGRAIGVSDSTVRNWWIGGTCEGCGRPTDGSNGRGRPIRFCSICWSSSPEGLRKKEAQTKWTADLIVTRIREWAALYGEPPMMIDWSPTAARYRHEEARARRFENADGRWPWASNAIGRFGSWSYAIRAAGFQPRSVGRPRREAA